MNYSFAVLQDSEIAFLREGETFIYFYIVLFVYNVV